FNANIIKTAERLIVRRRPELEAVSIVPVGRKGFDYFRRRPQYGEIARSWTGLSTVSVDHAQEIAGFLCERFEKGETDEVVLVYSEFISALTQRPTEHPLLPVSPPEAAETIRYETEPQPERLLGLLVPRAIEFAVFRALLENQAGEHGARMTAMDSATTNTEDLIRTLTLDYNKARQATITAELVEIVSGAEAL
ncbi:MAG: FoF1 ATP synthase subunit gamma, partial [Myxococcota bacterium]